MDYGFSHEGRTWTPRGAAIAETAEQSAKWNAEAEAIEIAWLRTAPDRVFLYVEQPPKDDYGHSWKIITWPGTSVGLHVHIGQSVPVGGIAGPRATKRSVDCRIFGTRYVGWYFESAGSYCRLKKAKRQDQV